MLLATPATHGGSTPCLLPLTPYPLPLTHTNSPLMPSPAVLTCACRTLKGSRARAACGAQHSAARHGTAQGTAVDLQSTKIDVAAVGSVFLFAVLTQQHSCGCFSTKTGAHWPHLRHPLPPTLPTNTHISTHTNTHNTHRHTHTTHTLMAAASSGRFMSFAPTICRASASARSSFTVALATGTMDPPSSTTHRPGPSGTPFTYLGRARQGRAHAGAQEGGGEKWSVRWGCCWWCNALTTSRHAGGTSTSQQAPASTYTQPSCTSFHTQTLAPTLSPPAENTPFPTHTPQKHTGP